MCCEVEKRLLELKEKTEALQTQNDYLGTRIDGNEEDKGALRRRRLSLLAADVRYDLRRTEDELRQATAVNGQLLQKRLELKTYAWQFGKASKWRTAITTWKRRRCGKGLQMANGC